MTITNYLGKRRMVKLLNLYIAERTKEIDRNREKYREYGRKVLSVYGKYNGSEWLICSNGNFSFDIYACGRTDKVISLDEKEYSERLDRNIPIARVVSTFTADFTPYAGNKDKRLDCYDIARTVRAAPSDSDKKNGISTGEQRKEAMNRTKELEKIRKSDTETITVKQAADALDFSYILLLRKMKEGEEVGFPYTRENGNIIISRLQFLKAVRELKWTLSLIEMLKLDYVTVKQASQCMGCAETTLRREIRYNEVGFEFYQLGGKLRIQREGFIRYMKG